LWSAMLRIGMLWDVGVLNGFFGVLYLFWHPGILWPQLPFSLVGILFFAVFQYRGRGRALLNPATANIAIRFFDELIICPGHICFLLYDARSFGLGSILIRGNCSGIFLDNLGIGSLHV